MLRVALIAAALSVCLGLALHPLYDLTRQAMLGWTVLWSAPTLGQGRGAVWIGALLPAVGLALALSGASRPGWPIRVVAALLATVSALLFLESTISAPSASPAVWGTRTALVLGVAAGMLVATGHGARSMSGPRRVLVLIIALALVGGAAAPDLARTLWTQRSLPLRARLELIAANRPWRNVEVQGGQGWVMQEGIRHRLDHRDRLRLDPADARGVHQGPDGVGVELRPAAAGRLRFRTLRRGRQPDALFINGRLWGVIQHNRTEDLSIQVDSRQAVRLYKRLTR